MKNGGKNKSVAFIILFSIYIYDARMVISAGAVDDPRVGWVG